MKFLLNIFILTLLNFAVIQTLYPTAVSAFESEGLDELILSISPDQVVGVPLIGTPQILLLDSLSNPVNYFDLNSNPITMSIDEGQLNPSIINDTTLLINGVINLIPLDIQYSGLSGLHTLSAFNDSAFSSGLLVSFNGYDILSAFDITGNTITTVYSGLSTNLNVEVSNGGNMTASTNPYVKAFFTSDQSGSVKHYFTPRANGVIDTIQFLIENTILATGDDTLVLVLESKYDIAGTIYSTEDTSKIPISVLSPATFTIIPGTMTPENVYAGIPFNFSFDIETHDFSGQIDSTFLSIDMVEYEGGPVISNLFTGSPELSDWSGGILTYDSVPAIIDSTIPFKSSYLISMDYRLISGANVFILTAPTPGSIFTLSKSILGHFDNRLAPRTVAVESEVQFSFDMHYFFDDDQTSRLELDAANSTFEISGSSFSSQTNLVFENDTLPNNGWPASTTTPFTVSSEKFIIPQAQLGETFIASALIRYRHLQSGNYLTYEILFDTEPIELIEYPQAQIINLKSIAFNPNRVNTQQEFQLELLVASQSFATLDDLQLKLSSDGNSQFDSIWIAPDISPFDTVVTYVDIITSNNVGTSEMFTVEIIDPTVEVVPPIDAIASVTIDSPADVTLACELSAGAVDSFLEHEENFSLVIGYLNSGTALISPVPFTFTTNGIDLGTPMLTEGIFQNDTNLVVLMTAPDYDTVINLNFDLHSLPIDQNTGLPALLNKQSFEAAIEVASIEASLTTIIDLSGEILLVPGSEIPILDLTLTNSGSSVQTEMILNSLIVNISSGDANIGANSYISAFESGFYENGQSLGQTNLGWDQLEFYFDNFIINAGQTRSIQLILKLKENLPQKFSVDLDQNSFDAEFLDDRLFGIDIPVESSAGVPLDFSQSFQSTGNSTETSFVIETNPFNPNLGPVRFAYILNEPSEIIFRIFSLTGELVHENVLAPGSPGTEISATPHMISWSGRNDAGHLVLNGIYLAHLSVSATGIETILKIAVVK